MKRRSQPVRVLLVEDDQIDRMAIERYILRQGLPFEIESAPSGAEAVQRLRDRPFDLVLLDYMLGDMTGLELLPELRGVPAIFISGMGNEEIAVRALHQGAYDYIVKDPDRAYLQMLPVIMRNVLERRKAEDSLRESQRKMDTLMRNLPGMAYRASSQGEIPLEFVSAGCLELTGYREEELTARGFGLRGLILAEDRDGHEQALNGAIQKGGAYELNYRIQPRAGEPKWVWERGVVVPGAAPGENVLEGFLSDITQRVNAEAQLRQAKDTAEQATVLKDKFVSLVAHDLRVPLTTCSLTFQMLWDELSAMLDPRHVELFKTLSNSSGTMLRMIDDLLLVSRLQSGVLRPKPRFLGAATIRSALIALDPLARQKQIGLSFQLPDGFRVYADPDLLGNVLQNLATNAIKFTNSGGKVTVSSANGEGVGIAIQDTGIGIEPERLQGLLAPERYNSTLGTAGEKGTGLGLRICQDILAAHNGHMTIESKPGGGTTVVVRLPVVRPQIVTFGLSDSDQTLVERTLTKFGADVQSLSGSRGVVDAIRRRRPHLIVAGSGRGGEQLEIIAALKADADVATVPIALLTSVPVKETGPDAPEDVMPLPVNEADLRTHLRRFLG